MYTSKIPRSSNFKLYLCLTSSRKNSVQMSEFASNLSNIFFEYYEFTNVFSKSKTKTLASYCFYDLQIKLEDSTQPLVSPIYLLLVTEQEALKEFIEKNLNTGFIWPTSSPHRASILFLRKRMAYSISTLTFIDLIVLQKKINIHFLLSQTFLTLLKKPEFTPR